MTFSLHRGSSGRAARRNRTGARSPWQTRSEGCRWRRLVVESLEDRWLLSIVPSLLSDDTATFVGSADQEHLYLRVTGGLLEFSETGGTYSNDLDLQPGVQALTVTPATTITVDLAEGNDRLTIQFSEVIQVAFDGGLGDDTLAGPNVASTWEITGPGVGLLNAQISFSNVENLTGGSGADTFAFLDGAAMAGTIDGGNGTDVMDILDYTHYTPLATANLTSGLATGTGGITGIEATLGEDDPLVFVHGFAGSMAKEGLTGYWLSHRGLHPDFIDMDPLYHTYDDLIQSFVNVGYRLAADGPSPQTLYVATWDWRMPVAPTDSTVDGLLENVSVPSITDSTFETGLDYLGYWLKRVSDDWFAQTGIRPDTVDIVAHSTGGLLARSYVQSSAYGGQFDADNDGLEVEDPHLPEVHDLVLVGVPSEGTPRTWNMLQNNFGECMETRAAGVILMRAYRDLKAGGTIFGPDDSITTDDIVWHPASPLSETEFIRRYIGTLVDLLPAYAFLEVGGELKTAAEVDPALANRLLLDLNPEGDANAFVDLLANGGTTTTVFGDDLRMIAGLVQRTGFTPSAGTSNLLVGLEDLVGHLPAPGETWYEPWQTAGSGDGTVPTVSSAGNFLADADRLAQGSLALRDMNATKHGALVYTVDSQTVILESLGITEVQQADVSTTLHTEDMSGVLANLVHLLFGEVLGALLVDDRDPANVEVYAAFLGDNLQLGASPGGLITIRDLDDGQELNVLTPAESLTIHLGLGDDVLMVNSPSTFHTNLNVREIFSAPGGDMSLSGIFDTLIGSSKVEFLADVILPGRDLDIVADKIIVGGAAVSTRKVNGTDQENSPSIDDSGNLHFEAEWIELQPGSRLLAHAEDGSSHFPGEIVLRAEDTALRESTQILPLDLNKNEATVQINDARIHDGDITITASAIDTHLSDDLGAYSDKALDYVFGVLDQIPDLAVSHITGISGQVVIHRADAKVTVTGSTIIGAGSVKLDSTASSDASLHTVSLNGTATGGAFTLAVGYGQAHSLADTKIDHTTIVAGDAVEVASDATTRAFVKARTTSNLQGTPNPKNVSLAIAVVHTKEESYATVTEGSSITSRTASVGVDATGGVTNFAWSQPVIYVDGTVATAFSLGLDTATIKARVDGAIDAVGGVSGTFDARDGGDVDYQANTIRIPGHGFTDGQEVLYGHGETDAPLGRAAPPDIGGLEDGEIYCVQVVDENTIRLTKAPTIDLDASRLPRDRAAMHKLTELDRIDFESVDVDIQQNTIAFAAPHGLQDGQAVTYLGAYSVTDEDGDEQNAGVAGLEQGETYYVVAVAGNDSAIQLAESPGGPPVDLTGAGAGKQAFLYERDRVAFAPAAAVDSDANTITFGGAHGFLTGDAVIYHTDPDVTRANSLGSQAVIGPDVPIGGLSDGASYFVVKVDDRTIRLVSSRAAADDAAPIDLTKATGMLGVGLGDAHILASSSAPDGISIHAGLAATNNIYANAGMTGEAFRWTQLGDSDRTFQPEQIYALVGKLTEVGKKALDKQPENSPTKAGASFGIAPSIAVNRADHRVDAIIGNTARLASSKDVAVAAEISQASQVASCSSAAKPEGAGAEHSVALAVGLGMFRNTAKATVESGAWLDAHGATSIDARVDYPFLIANPWTAINPLDYLKQTGPEGFSYFNDGTLGYASNLFNTWVITSASQSKVAAGGSIAINLYDNNAEARIKSGARINQQTDSRFRGGLQVVDVDAAVEMNLIGVAGVGGLSLSIQNLLLEPIDRLFQGKEKPWESLTQLVKPFGAEGGKDGIGASFLVEVLGNTTEAVIENGAMIHAGWSRSFDPGAGAIDGESWITLPQAFGLATGTPLVYRSDPAGTPIGNLLDGQTYYVIADGQNPNRIQLAASEDDAAVGTAIALVPGEASGSHHSLEGPGLTVSATTDVFDLALAQAGGKASSFAVAGAFAIGVFLNTTKAYIESGAKIDSASTVTVAANDQMTRIGITGGVVAAENCGVGASISVNFVDRDTQAFIGSPKGDPPGAAGTSIVAAGPIEVRAASTGGLWTVSLAAAFTNEQPPTEKEIEDNARIKSAPSKAQRTLGETGESDQQKIAVGGAGDVSVNVIVENTYAYINDTGTFATDRKLDLSSTADTAIWSLAGSVAFAKGEKSSRGIAGSLSANVLTGNTKAFVSGATVAAGSLSLLAERKGGIRSLTAGGSGAPLKGGIAAAGSFSANVVIGTVDAWLDGTTATLAYDSSIHAENECQIWAIGGALGYGGKGGIGVAIAVNVLGSDLDPNKTRAYVKNSTVTMAGGTLEVSATNENPSMDPRIIAITGSLGIDAGAESYAGAGTIAVNVISNDTEAYLESSTITETPDNPGTLHTHLKARDNSGIHTISGAVAVSKGTSLGAAIAYNEIDNDVKAYFDNADLTASGTVTLEAWSGAVIGGAAVGVAAVTGSAKLAGAGSISINKITNTAAASIENTVDGASRIATHDDIALTAEDHSKIVSITGGFSGATKGSAVGAAISYNLIQNTIKATIEDAVVAAEGAGSSIELSATSDSELVSIAVGGAGAQGFALGGSLTVNAIANTLDAHIADTTDVHAGDDVTLTAAESDWFLVIAGGVGASWNGSAVGAALAYNYLGGSFNPANPNLVDRNSNATDQIIAYIDNAHVVAGGNLIVRAGSEPSSRPAPASVEVGGETVALPLDEDMMSRILSVTVGAAGADGFALGGSVSINVIAHDIKAHISGSRVVEAAGSILVSAADDLDMGAAAGGFGLSLGGSGSAVGIANATQITKNNVLAYIGQGARVNAGGNGAGVAAPDGTTVGETPQTVTAKGLAVTATSFEDVLTIAVGGAFATGTAGVAGSAAVTVLIETTKATIAENAVINSGGGESDEQSVLVLASDRTSHRGVGGALGIGKSAGVGAGVDVGVFTKTTEARIASGADVEALGDVQVQANSAERVVSVAGGAGIGKDLGLAGGVDVYVLNVTTRSLVEGAKTVDGTAYAGAAVGAGGSVVVAAEEKTTLDVISGSIAFGTSAGIGGAAGVPIVVKTTEAFIGNSATVDAKGRGSGVDVRTGEFGITFEGDSGQDGEISPFGIGNSDVVDDSLTGQRVATPVTRSSFKGVAVTAVNRDDIETYGVGAGVSTTASFQLSATVNVMTSNTSAYIGDGARVNQDPAGDAEAAQSVLVAAGNDYYHMGIAGAVALTVNINGVAMSPGADVAVVANTTEAYIGAGAMVDAKRDIEVRAHAAEDILSIAAAVAGGGNFAGAGSVSVIVLNNETRAYIAGGAVLDAGGNVLVWADDGTDVDVIAGALGVGLNGGGAGVGVGVIVINKDTEAYVGQNAHVEAKGNSDWMKVFDGTLDDTGKFGMTGEADDVRGLAVAAVSSESVVAVAAAGAGGLYAGVAGGVTVEVIDSNTRAYIDAGAIINTDISGAHANQDVHVTAANDLSMLVIDGAIGGGLGAGVAGGVDVGIVRNDTTAYIAGSDVRARRDIAVNALANRQIESYAVSAGFGAVGLAAAVSVYALGGNLQESYAFDKDDDGAVETGESQNALAASDGTTTSGFADSQVGLAGLSDLLGGYADGGDVQDAASSARTSFNDATPENPVGGATGATVGDTQTVGTQTVPRGTVAFIGAGASVAAGRDVDLDARERVDLQAIAGGLGAGGVGGGASISIINVDDQVKAFIASGATVTAGTLEHGGDVRIDAKLTSDLSVLAVTAGLGGVGGLAGSVVVIHDSSKVGACTEAGTIATDRASVLSADQVVLTAERDPAIHASTLGIGAGGTWGFGAAVTIVEVTGETKAEVGDWTRIGADTIPATVDSLQVKATSTTSIGAYELENVTTTAVGLAVAGTGAGAAGVSLGKIADNTEATIGSHADILVGGHVSVDAESISTADLDADGGALAGALAVGGMVASAEIEGATRARVGSESSLGCGSLHVNATVTATAEVDTIAAAGGLLAAGSGSVALAKVKPTIEAAIGDHADVHAASDINVTSTSTADADARARGLSIAAGAALGISWAEAEVTPDIDTGLGREATIVAGGDITLRSLHNLAPDGFWAVLAAAPDGSPQVGDYDIGPAGPEVYKGAHANASASGGALLAGNGAQADASAGASMDTYVGAGAHVAAGQDVIIVSQSSNHADAVADAVTVGAAAGNRLEATVSVNGSTDHTHAYIASSSALPAMVNAGGCFALLADSFNSANAFTNAASGGAFAGGDAIADIDVNNNTGVYLAPHATVIAAEAVTIVSQSEIAADAETVLHAGAALAYAEGKATIDIGSGTAGSEASDVFVRLAEGSAVEGNVVTVTAIVAHVDAGARSDTKTYAADSQATAASHIVMNTDARVDVEDAAIVVGHEFLSITAFQDNPSAPGSPGFGSDLDSTAEAQVAGATGRARTDLVGAITANTTVNIFEGAQLTSADVELIALAAHHKKINSDATAYTVQQVVENIPIIGWVVQKVTKLLKVQSTAESIGGAVSDQSKVILDGTINLVSPKNRSLTVTQDALGNVSFEGDIAAHVDGNDIVVHDVVNDLTGAVRVEASTNAGDGELAGSGTILLDRAYERVAIRNDSDKNLRLGTVDFWPETAENPAVSFLSSNGGSYAASTNVTRTPVLDIQNARRTTVSLAGEIHNPSGLVKISNDGGSIVSETIPLRADSFELSAPAGNIGGPLRPLPLAMQAGTLQARAGGDVYLEIRRQQDENAVALGYEYFLEIPARITDVTAGGSVQLTLDQGATIVRETVAGERREYQFSVGSGYATTLDAGTLSDPLRRKFETEGISVTSLEPLFSVGREYQSDLDAGVLSAELQSQFTTNGITLSNYATIERKLEDGEWQIHDSTDGAIDDDDKTYLVVSEDTSDTEWQLTVYELTSGRAAVAPQDDGWLIVVGPATYFAQKGTPEHPDIQVFRDFVYDSQVGGSAPAGATYVIGNVEALGSVTIAGKVGSDGEHARVNIESAGGDSHVRGQVITLQARDGHVGTVAMPVQTDVTVATGRIDVIAGGDIVVAEIAGKMPVGAIDSARGDVRLSASDGIVAAAGFDRLAGNSIALAVDNGSIGEPLTPLAIDSAHLVAAAWQDIYVREVDGPLDVLGATAILGSIKIAAPGGELRIDRRAEITAAGSLTLQAGDDLRVLAGSQITAGSVAIEAGDNVYVFAGSRITATVSVSIACDHGDADAQGGFVVVGGELLAPAVQITGQSDSDTIDLTNVSPGSAVTVLAGAGDDLIQVGNELARIQGRLILDGGTGDNRLAVRDGEDGQAGVQAGQLESRRISGFGMPSGGSIEYDGFSLMSGPGLVVTLYDADGYEVTVLGASVSTLLVLGTGGDKVVFDSEAATAQGAILGNEDQTLHVFNLGLIGDVYLANAEEVAVKLSDGSDQLTVDLSLTGVPIEIAGRDGDDTVIIKAVGHTTMIDGGDGTDEVKVEIPGNPAEARYDNLLDYLACTVETLTVDNRSYSAPVEWTVRKKGSVLCAGQDPFLSTFGVSEVYLVVPPENGSTLKVEEIDGHVTIRGNRVELNAPAPVLSPEHFRNGGFTYSLGTLADVADVAAFGDFVYTASPGDDTVAVFQDVGGGRLEVRQVFKDGLGGVNCLDGASRIAVSDDGLFVYASASLDDALAVFRRDPQSGLLTWVQEVRDGVDGVNGLKGVVDFALSGNILYAAAPGDNALAVFTCNSGLLILKEVVWNTPSTNVALNKSASQSSTYGNYTYCGADRAVDGITYPIWQGGSGNSISHTAASAGAWWQVELGGDYHLDHVKLFDRSGYPLQLSNFSVIVYNDGVAVWQSPLISRVSDSGGGSRRIDLPAGTVGDRVRIRNEGADSRVLVIAECAVYTRGGSGLTGINSVTVSEDGLRLYTTADNGAVSVFACTPSGDLDLLYELGGSFPTTLAHNTTSFSDATFTGPPDGLDGRNLPAGSVITFDFGNNQGFLGGRFNVYELDWGEAEFGKIKVEVSANSSTWQDVTSTRGAALSIPGDETHGDIAYAQSYSTEGSAVRYVRITAVTAGFDLDAVGAQVIPSASGVAEIVEGGRRVLYVMSEGSSTLQRFDVSLPLSYSRLSDVNPGLGALTAIESIADESLELHERFLDGDTGNLADAANPYAGKWTVVDEGTISSPSHWYVSDGVLIQDSNIYGEGEVANRKGTYVYCEDEAERCYQWTDYELAADLFCADNDGIGVLFRYTGSANYYKFEMDNQRSFRKLFRIADGVETVLWSDPTPYVEGAWFNLKVRTAGSTVQVLVNNSEVCRVTDPSPLMRGTVAMYCWGQQGAKFDNIRVRQLPAVGSSRLSGLYVLGENILGAYRVDPVTFSLAAMDTAAFDAGGSPAALCVTKDKVYVADPGADALHVFARVFAVPDAPPNEFVAGGGHLITLKNLSPDIGDQFGESVAVSEEFIAVGVPRADYSGASNPGAVYLFHASTGEHFRTLVNPSPGTDDLFGFSVAISGNTIVVGAPRAHESYYKDCGQVWVFDATDPSVQIKIPNRTVADYDLFGYSVAASGDILVVGTPYADYSSVKNPGAAYVYQRNGNSYDWISTLVRAPGPQTSALFGWSVAASGDHIVVGAPWVNEGATDNGAAYVYRRNAQGQYEYHSKLVNTSIANSDVFGYSLGMSGDRLVIGAPLVDYGGLTDPGEAHLYALDETGSYAHRSTLRSPSPAGGDQVGIAVAISGDKVLAGAYGTDRSGKTDAGAAYVFNAATGSLMSMLVEPTPQASARFGNSVAISGNTAVVGAYTADDGGKADSGLVHVFATTGELASAATGDLNRDGVPDLVTANSSFNTVSVLLGSGHGAFQPAVNFVADHGPSSVALADVNGDGLLDLVTANSQSNNVSVLLGNGDGTFRPAANFATGKGPASLALADLNGDGLPDLITVNFDSDDVSVLLGDGNGDYPLAVNFAVGDGPSSVAVADFNGDGLLDLATANFNADEVSLLLNRSGGGNLGFGDAATFAAGDGPISLAAADLNGDGLIDLVTANFNSHDVSVLLSDDYGNFLSKADFAAGDGPRSVAVATLHGDDHPDLVTANFNAGTLSVLLGAGGGNFPSTMSFAAGDGPRWGAAVDLNGDSLLDLLSVAQSSHGVNVLLSEADFGPMATTEAADARLTGQPLELTGLQSVVTSPDGRFVYAVNREANALIALEIVGQATLSFVASYVDGCLTETGPVSGLKGAGQIAVNPVYGELYVLASDEPAIALFDRDPATGKLTSRQNVIVDPGTTALVVSPDGQTVYTSSPAGLAIRTRQADGSLGVPSAHSLPGDWVIRSASLSAGNTLLFLTSDSLDTVKVLQLSGGVFSLLQDIESIADPSDVALSPDGQSLFITGAGGGSLDVLVRQADGKYLLTQSFREGQDGVRGIGGASSVAVAPLWVFVTGGADDTLAVFARDPNTGELQFSQACRTWGDVWLQSPNSVAVLSDGTVLVGSSEGVQGGRGGIAIFNHDAAMPALSDVRFEDVRALTVQAGGGDDTFLLDASSIERLVTVNGIAYSSTPEEAMSFTFDGLGGTDHLELVGGAGVDVAILRPQTAALTGVGYKMTATHFESTTFDGGGGDDLARLYGSRRANAFSLSGDETAAGTYRAVLGGSGVAITAMAERVYAKGNGGRDTAELCKLADTDRLEQSWRWARTTGEGYACWVDGFRGVVAYENEGSQPAEALSLDGTVDRPPLTAMQKAVLTDAVVGQDTDEVSAMATLDDVAQLIWLDEYQRQRLAKTSSEKVNEASQFDRVFAWWE